MVPLETMESTPLLLLSVLVCIYSGIEIAIPFEKVIVKSGVGTMAERAVERERKMMRRCMIFEVVNRNVVFPLELKR